MLLGELGQLHQLRDYLLDIVTVGAVYQGVGHGIQDGLVTGLKAPGQEETERSHWSGSSVETSKLFLVDPSHTSRRVQALCGLPQGLTA